MELMTQVLYLDEVVYISLCVNALGKGMNLSLTEWYSIKETETETFLPSSLAVHK